MNAGTVDLVNEREKKQYFSEWGSAACSLTCQTKLSFWRQTWVRIPFRMLYLPVGRFNLSQHSGFNKAEHSSESKMWLQVCSAAPVCKWKRITGRIKRDSNCDPPVVQGHWKHRQQSQGFLHLPHVWRASRKQQSVYWDNPGSSRHSSPWCKKGWAGDESKAWVLSLVGHSGVYINHVDHRMFCQRDVQTFRHHWFCQSEVLKTQRRYRETQTALKAPWGNKERFRNQAKPVRLKTLLHWRKYFRQNFREPVINWLWPCWSLKYNQLLTGSVSSSSNLHCFWIHS